MTAAIQTNKLSMQYENHFALRDLDLKVDAGEVFGFLGHNGAGKTTTLSILTTLLKPTSGRALVCGHDVVSDGFEARRCLGYVPENVRLYEGMTANDNLRFLAKLSGIRKPDEEIRQTLNFLECEDLGERRVGTMSKGQRQRIGLAQAILHRPQVLFLDEPTSGLDPLGIKTLRDLIVRLNKERGTTIFMNTHLISEVSKTCTSIAVLNHGRLVFHDTIAEVLNRFGDDTALEHLYLSLVPSEEV
jgi:ABC-2 type transport system ATP-binding protein